MPALQHVRIWALALDKTGFGPRLFPLDYLGDSRIASPKNNSNLYLAWFLWVRNEIKHVKYLTSHLAHNEFSVNDGCLFYYWAHPANEAPCHAFTTCTFMNPCLEGERERRNEEIEEFEGRRSMTSVGQWGNNLLWAHAPKGGIPAGSALTLFGQGLLLPLYPVSTAESLAPKMPVE